MSPPKLSDRLLGRIVVAEFCYTPMPGYRPVAVARDRDYELRVPVVRAPRIPLTEAFLEAIRRAEGRRA